MSSVYFFSICSSPMVQSKSYAPDSSNEKIVSTSLCKAMESHTVKEKEIHKKKKFVTILQSTTRSFST